MSENTKLDPATLTAEEKAIVEEMVTRDQMFWPPTQSSNALVMDKPDLWKQSYDCAFNRILARRALFGTVTEKAQESAFPVGNCKVCGELVAPYNKHAKYEGGYTCQPAQPEPADSRQERADQIKSFLGGDDDEPARLEPAAPIAQEWDENVPAPIGFNKPEPAETVDTRDEQIAYARSIFDKPEPAAQGEMPDEVDRACDLLEWSGNVNAAAALRDAWRTHSQPNCSRCGKPFVDGAYHHPKNVDVCGTCYVEMRPKVELGKVRKTLAFMRERCVYTYDFKFIDDALDELDAVEGRK